MQSIQKGSLVRLLSGGPVMTVQGFSNSRDVALCAWFDGATLRSEPLVTASLVGIAGADARGLHSPAPLVPARPQVTVELP
jgi:uncharacterized protein YodC (DUF2158 family)